MIIEWLLNKETTVEKNKIVVGSIVALELISVFKYKIQAKVENKSENILIVKVLYVFSDFGLVQASEVLDIVGQLFEVDINCVFDVLR